MEFRADKALRQTAKDLRKSILGMPGIVGDSERDYSCSVTAATIQALRSYL
jgi:hypothetical protein